jgi:hypothetical protein
MYYYIISYYTKKYENTFETRRRTTRIKSAEIIINMSETQVLDTKTNTNTHANANTNTNANANTNTNTILILILILIQY